jgi:hypothetical protein
VLASLKSRLEESLEELLPVASSSGSSNNSDGGGEGESSNSSSSCGPGTSASQQQQHEKKEKEETMEEQEQEVGSKQGQQQDLCRSLQKQLLLAQARSVWGWGCHNSQCTSLEGVSEGKVKGRRCMGCLTARYCSVSCQKAAYREHKLVCKHLGQQQQQCVHQQNRQL